MENNKQKEWFEGVLSHMDGGNYGLAKGFFKKAAGFGFTSENKEVWFFYLKAIISRDKTQMLIEWFSVIEVDLFGIGKFALSMQLKPIYEAIRTIEYGEQYLNGVNAEARPVVRMILKLIQE